MVCTGFHSKIAPDLEGNARRAIVFELTPRSSVFFLKLLDDIPQLPIKRDGILRIMRSPMAVRTNCNNPPRIIGAAIRQTANMVCF